MGVAAVGADEEADEEDVDEEVVVVDVYGKR